MVQRLLSSDEFKMDPLVSVYCKYHPTTGCAHSRLAHWHEFRRRATDLAYRIKTSSSKEATNPIFTDYAPACAIINGFFTIFIELPRMTTGDIIQVGLMTLVANAFVAFLLNVSVVLLVCVECFYDSLKCYGGLTRLNRLARPMLSS